MAVSQQDFTLLIRAQDQASVAINSVVVNLGRLEQQAATSGNSFGQLAGAMTVGGVAANAISGAFSAVANAASGAAQGVLSLASRLEQARIGFTTMLGSVEKADEFIGQLQQKAESTAFNFPGIQQVAQSFLAMGIDAKNVIPIIDDVSNALSAAGHGGETDRLERIGQSLSEIAAQGKLSGEQIRELSRNGIAVLPLLAEAFGKTEGEVKKMAEASEISATKFFEAFHSEIALHYGDIQAQQARTWAVAFSNLQDIIGRVATTTFKELTDAATATALVINDFLHSDRFLQWAADVQASIHVVLQALAPLGEAFKALLGASSAPAGPQLSARELGPTPTEIKAAMSVPPEAIKSAADYDIQIKQATADIHDTTEALTALGAQQQALKDKIEDTTRTWDLRLRGLHDQQEANNLAIEATKTKYEAVLTPLEKQSTALQRLGEDTKKTFANILDPLKAALTDTTDRIATIKANYERLVTPIERQIAAIDKANTALQRQRQLVVDLADLELRKQKLAALGDPNLRASIASQLESLDLSRADLERRKELLSLGDGEKKHKGELANLDKQLDNNTRGRLKLEQQLADAADKRKLAQIAGQEVLNDAQRETLAITQKEADIAADKQKAPLQAQLDTAKQQVQKLLDPLEAQARALGLTIEAVGRSEAAAVKPITEAQESVARTIQDTNQALKDALKPLEDAGKSIADQITAAESAKAKALAPLKDELDDLDRKSHALDLHKRQLADEINEWKDLKEKIKEAAAEAAKIQAPLDLSGGKTPEGPPASKVGTPLISQAVIDNLHTFSAAVADVNVQVAAFNSSGGLTTLSNSVLLLGTVFVGAQIVEFLAGIALGLAGVIAFTGQVAAGFGILGGAAGAVGGALAGVSLVTLGVLAAVAALVVGLAAYIANFNGFRDQVNAAFVGIKDGVADTFTQMGEQLRGTIANLLKDNREGGLNPFPTMVDWFKNFPQSVTQLVADIGGVFSGMGANLKAAADLMLKPASQGGSNPFPDWLAAFEGFLASIKPTVDNIVKVFDPLGQALTAIADALSKLPQALPGWLTRALGGGGNFQTTSLGGVPDRGAIGGDALSLTRGGGAGNLQGDTLLRYVFDRFSSALGEEAGRAAASVALTEGGLHGAVGDTGTSFGVFQFHEGGQLDAFAAWLNTSLEDAANVATNRPDLAVQFALEKYLGQTLQAGLAAGLSGPDLATYLQRYGQVSVSPERAGQSYTALFGAGGTIPQTTVDLSGGTSGLQRTSLPAQRNWSPDLAEAQTAATRAQAAAQAGLNQIMSGQVTVQGQVTASAVAQTATVQQAIPFTERLAQAQAALNQVLTLQAPAGRAAADAMSEFRDLLLPIDNQVAHGAISADTLRFKLLDLARATGLNTDAWDAFNAGTLDSVGAMDRLINATADLGPDFKAVQDYQKTAGSTSNQAALMWLQAAEHYQQAKATLVAAATTTPVVPGAAVTSVDQLGVNWTDVKAAADLATTAATGYQITISHLDASKITEQRQAWDDDTTALGKLSDAAHSLGDYLDGHTFRFHVDLPDLPDWAIPGSPTPFELGLRGIGRELDALRAKGGPSLRSIAAPLAHPSLASVSPGARSAGPSITWTGDIIVQGADNPRETARAIRDELIKLGIRNGGRVLS